MISRKELFAEISNDAVCEDGEVVGYFVKNSRMDLLEQMLCSQVTVTLPKRYSCEGYHIDEAYLQEDPEGDCYDRDEVLEALAAAGIQVIEGEQKND